MLLLNACTQKSVSASIKALCNWREPKKHFLQYATVLLMVVMNVAVLFAQDGLQRDKAYFYDNLKVYQSWLDSTQLANILTIKQLQVEPSLLILKMNVTSKEDWFDLKDEFQQRYQLDAGKKLFDKFAYQMAVGRDSVRVFMNCTAQNYPISMRYLNGQFVIEEELPMVSTKGAFSIKLADIPANNTQLTNGKREAVKLLITDYLRNYYEQKRVLWQKARFNLIDSETEMLFEISNIKKEVLDDFFIGYFELITINMTFEQKGDAVEVNYELQAKYGSGIFVAPRRSGYKDMEPKYQDYIDRYRLKFKSMIQGVLNAEKLRG